jgi:hypothetical protein
MWVAWWNSFSSQDCRKSRKTCKTVSTTIMSQAAILAEGSCSFEPYPEGRAGEQVANFQVQYVNMLLAMDVCGRWNFGFHE